MIINDSYRLQHNELLEIISHLHRLLASGERVWPYEEINNYFSLLNRRLIVHLALEDKALYPTLLSGTDEHIRSVAQKFVDEMGDLHMAFKEFIKRWFVNNAIEENLVKFKDESKAMLSALEQRIKKENAELLPLLDLR